MAQLPPDGEYLIQQIGSEVVLFQRYTEAEIVRFDPSAPESFGPALGVIWDSTELSPEQKCFAAFWAGYFYAHASAGVL